MAEQRYKAVLAVIADGRTVTEVARDWGESFGEGVLAGRPAAIPISESIAIMRVLDSIAAAAATDRGYYWRALRCKHWRHLLCAVLPKPTRR